jgi:hypothetical protein
VTTKHWIPAFAGMTAIRSGMKRVRRVSRSQQIKMDPSSAEGRPVLSLSKGWDDEVRQKSPR